MGLVEAIMEGSSLVQEVRERAEAKGEAKEARRLLRLALADRFPGLEAMPELDRIANVADLESLLLRHAFRAGVTFISHSKAHISMRLSLTTLSISIGLPACVQGTPSAPGFRRGEVSLLPRF